MVRRHFEKCYGHWESPQSWAASTNQIARNDIVTSKFILMYVLHSRRPFCSLRIPLLLALVTITQLFTRARPLAARVLKWVSLLSSTVSQTGSLINRYSCVH